MINSLTHKYKDNWPPDCDRKELPELCMRDCRKLADAINRPLCEVSYWFGEIWRR